MLDPRIVTELRPCQCEDCGLTYEEASWGGPRTDRPYTCDDYGGYVMDADETKAALFGEETDSSTEEET